MPNMQDMGTPADSRRHRYADPRYGSFCLNCSDETERVTVGYPKAEPDSRVACLRCISASSASGNLWDAELAVAILA